MHLHEIADQIRTDHATHPRVQALIRDLSHVQVQDLLTRYEHSPVIRTNELEKRLLHEYYYQVWWDVFRQINLAPDARILEVAPGQSIMIPRALEKYTQGKGSFIAANLNQKLTQKLRAHLADLTIETRVIEDDAVNLLQYFQKHTFDLIGLNHAVNDMFEYLAAKTRDIDTVTLDWEANFPLMIESLEAVHACGTLESTVKSEFLATIEVFATLIKPHGYLILNNYVFQEQLDFGASFALYDALIEIIREWIHPAPVPFEEMDLDDVPKRYWLVLKKTT